MSSYLYTVFLSLVLDASVYADTTLIADKPSTRQESSNQMMTATGKQRLSTKAQDENRVNDCRVDEQFRQEKERIADCNHDHVIQHLEQEE